ncbi:MAG: hypothetical protein EBT22_09985, partial [Chloroflexi bacterium]|nr:hypothetical protein [Chloroflexota bacterium]
MARSRWLDGNGAPLANWGNGGAIIADVGPWADGAAAMLQQGDGAIVMVGSSARSSLQGDIALTRYLANGSLDTRFGEQGTVVTSVNAGRDSAQAAVLQADGRILVAGSTISGGKSSLLLMRYLADGKLDTSFGTVGVTTTAAPGSDLASVSGAALALS